MLSLIAVPSCAIPMYFLQSLRTLLFQLGRLFPLACIQIYKYMYGRLILKICLICEMFLASAETRGLLSDCKSVCFPEFLIYSGCFF